MTEERKILEANLIDFLSKVKGLNSKDSEIYKLKNELIQIIEQYEELKLDKPKTIKNNYVDVYPKSNNNEEEYLYTKLLDLYPEKENLNEKSKCKHCEKEFIGQTCQNFFGEN